MAPRIGVLALQGAFAEHIAVLDRVGAETVEVRLPSQLAELDGLVIPGGESTSISLLMSEYDMFEPLRKMATAGRPILGTCAGLILLARLSPNTYPHTLAVMDIEVKRNAYGRQVDSFEVNLDIPALGHKPFPGVFIRAPKISRVGPAVQVLCRLRDGDVVAARQGKLLCCAFHPELTSDARLHRYFLDMVSGSS